MTENVLSAPRDDIAVMAAELAQLRAPDIVEQLNETLTAEAVDLLGHLPFDRVVEVFDDPDLDGPEDLFAYMEPDRAAAILAAMSADRAADVLSEIPEPLRDQLVRRLQAETARELRQLIAYPEGHGRLAHDDRIRQRPGRLDGRAHARPHPTVERTRETNYATYLLDPVTSSLVKAVTLRRLIVAEPDSPSCRRLATGEPLTVGPMPLARRGPGYLALRSSSPCRSSTSSAASSGS